MAIKGDAELKAFLDVYGFRELGANAKWNIGEFEASYHGTKYRIGYRWHDPSQVYSVRSDVHKARLWSIDAQGAVCIHGDIEFDENA
nr:hypothetical protein [Burkholderia sp. Tr-20390]